MRYLASFVRFGFGFQAFLGIFTFAVAPSMVSSSLHQGLFVIALTLLAGTILFVSLNLIPAIAWWALREGKRSARAWTIAACLINIAWTPLVAGCTKSGAMLLALIGICGLIVFWGRPLWTWVFRFR